jgi:iron-sulfur cluster repair protein YtfE (RIC family)
MKRDPALSELSRDHHQALFVAMKLKRADDDDAAEVREQALEYWRAHGAAHFRIEEDILLPAFASRADPDQEAVVRVLVDHVWIRERMERLEAGELGLPQLQELGARLDDHVRHEERVLFPLIEEALAGDALADLARRLEAAEAG